MVQAKNLWRRRFRNRVGEFLAVRKDLFHLYLDKEVPEDNLRRIRILLCGNARYAKNIEPHNQNGKCPG
jgi:hypothetical protein